MKSFETRETTTKQTTKSGHLHDARERWEKWPQWPTRICTGEKGPHCDTVRPVEWENEWGGDFPVSLMRKLGWEQRKARITFWFLSSCGKYLRNKATDTKADLCIPAACKSAFFFRVCSRTPAFHRKQLCDPHLKLRKQRRKDKMV